MGVTISGMTGRGSIRHNNRLFSAANIDRSRTGMNVTFCQEDLKQVYHQVFDEALAAYNAKKKKTRDKIPDYFQDFAAQLPHTGRFYVCGRGLVVNLSQVSRVLENVLLLKNGEELSFSRNRRREIQKAHAEWYANRTRKGGWAK